MLSACLGDEISRRNPKLLPSCGVSDSWDDVQGSPAALADIWERQWVCNGRVNGSYDALSAT